jgi:hypothetical protein
MAAITVTDLVRQGVQAVLQPQDEENQKRLEQHLELLDKLGGKAPTTDDLKAALKDGWTPDMFSGVDATINFSGTIATVHERELAANGSISLGPATLGVTFGDKSTEQNTGSISGTITMKRQSRTQGVEDALAALAPLATPVLPDQPAPITNKPATPTK